MQRLALGVSLAGSIAACYAPAVPSGVPCSSTMQCPGGQTCVAGRCDGDGEGPAPGDAPLADRDQDGRADADDNCPDRANATQADEDADALGDACDPCPGDATGAAADADGDGTGDACDPDLAAMAPDRLWLFESFAAVPSWARSVQWTPAGDGDRLRVVAPGDDDDDDEYMVAPLDVAGRSYDSFRLGVAFDVENASGGFPEIGLAVFDSTRGAGLYCSLFQTGGQAPQRRFGLSDDLSLGNTVALAWQNGAAYTLTLVRRGTSYSCSVTGPGGPRTLTGTSPVAPRSGAATEVWAFGVTARVDWFHAVGP